MTARHCTPTLGGAGDSRGIQGAGLILPRLGARIDHTPSTKNLFMNEAPKIIATRAPGTLEVKGLAQGHKDSKWQR